MPTAHDRQLVTYWLEANDAQTLRIALGDPGGSACVSTCSPGERHIRTHSFSEEETRTWSRSGFSNRFAGVFVEAFR